MKAQATYDILGVLVTKAQALQSVIGATVGAGGAQPTMDQVSEHTGYGIPEVIVEDIITATSLITSSYNKILAITSPTSALQ